MPMMIVIIAIAAIAIWIMSLGAAELIGNLFIKHVIDPIKDLFQ